MAKIGSSEWFTETADKVIDMGLGVIKTKLQGVDAGSSGDAPAYQSATSSSTRWLPYAIGAALVGGIVLILAKR